MFVQNLSTIIIIVVLVVVILAMCVAFIIINTLIHCQNERIFVGDSELGQNNPTTATDTGGNGTTADQIELANILGIPPPPAYLPPRTSSPLGTQAPPTALFARSSQENLRRGVNRSLREEFHSDFRSIESPPVPAIPNRFRGRHLSRY